MTMICSTDRKRSGLVCGVPAVLQILSAVRTSVAPDFLGFRPYRSRPKKSEHEWRK